MRKKIAFFLALSIIHGNISILANTDGAQKDSQRVTAATPDEAERYIEKENPKESVTAISEACDECDTVYKVLFPTQTHAYLDPGNLSGRGQIFSDQYEIENYGSTDVAIKIKKIEIDLKSPEELYEVSETEITDSQSSIKKMNADMIWRNKDSLEEKVLHINNSFPDEYVIWLKAAEYDANGEFVSLNKDSIGYFYFTGTLNSNPNIEWDDGELMVRFSYEIVNAGAGENSSKVNVEIDRLDSQDMEQIGTDSNAESNTQKD